MPATLVIPLVVAVYAIVSGSVALLVERHVVHRGARTWRRRSGVSALVGIGFGIVMLVLVATAAGRGSGS